MASVKKRHPLLDDSAWGRDQGEFARLSAANLQTTFVGAGYFSIWRMPRFPAESCEIAFRRPASVLDRLSNSQARFLLLPSTFQLVRPGPRPVRPIRRCSLGAHAEKYQSALSLDRLPSNGCRRYFLRASPMAPVAALMTDSSLLECSADPAPPILGRLFRGRGAKRLMVEACAQPEIVDFWPALRPANHAWLHRSPTCPL
jgi:hypothetical protein